MPVGHVPFGTGGGAIPVEATKPEITSEVPVLFCSLLPLIEAISTKTLFIFVVRFSAFFFKWKSFIFYQVPHSEEAG
jgi:hypothetical protein